MPSLKKILLITASLFIVACGGKVSTDTVQLSKDFMKALFVIDEKTIEKITHPMAGYELSMEHGIKPYSEFLKEHKITVEELQYAVQKGQSDAIECVVVKSNGSRVDVKDGDLPRVNWRLTFIDNEGKGLRLDNVDIFYGNFIDKGCVE